MSSWLGGWGIVTGWLRVKGNFIGEKEHQGSRVLITAGLNSTMTETDYLAGTSAVVFNVSIGYVMPNDGSVISISANLRNYSETTPGDVAIDVMINNAVVFSLVLALNGGSYYTGYITQNRGIDTFSAGDRLQVQLRFIDYVGTVQSPLATIGVQFDT